MGTYQKMKKVKADIDFLEKVVDNCEYWNGEGLPKDQLESAREKYRSLKYEYTIQSSILILVVFVTIAITTSYLLGGV